MKKFLAILVSLALVAVILPAFGGATVPASATTVDSYDGFSIYNTSGIAEVLSCKKMNGRITVKVKLGMDDYLQFTNPVTDLIDKTGALQVSLEEHDFGTTHAGNQTLADAYNATSFRIAVTENANPGNTGIITRWLFDGKAWGLITGYSINQGYNSTSYIATGSMISREIAMSFTFARDTSNGNKIRLDSEDGDDLAAASMLSSYAPADNTPIYVRLVSNKTEQIFNIRLNSDSIAGYPEIANVYNTYGTVTSDAEIESIYTAGGYTAVKVKLGVGDYIQFAQPVDIIDKGSIDLSLGDHDFGTVPGTEDSDLADAYFNCNIRLELTDDPDYTNTGVDARWALGAEGSGYGNIGGDNHYIVAVAGTRAGGANTYRYIARKNSLMNRGVALSMTIDRDATTNQLRLGSIYSDNNTHTEQTDTLYQSSYQPTDEDDVYLRVRSEVVQTYNIRVNSYRVTDLVSITGRSIDYIYDYTWEDGSVVVKTELVHGNAIQFTKTVTDLIDNPGVLEINLGDHNFDTVPTGDTTDIENAYKYMACYLFVSNSNSFPNPDTTGSASWPLYGNSHPRISSGNPIYVPVIQTNKNDGWGGANFSKYVTRVSSMISRGVALPLEFHTDGSGKIYYETTVKDGSDLFDGTTTDSFVPGNNPLYIRLLDYENYSSYTGHSTVYNIRLNSSAYAYERADYTDVEDAIDAYEDMTYKGVYTSATRAAVESAIAAADVENKLDYLNQSTVDGYAAAINAAIAALTVDTAPFKAASVTLSNNLKFNFYVPKTLVDAMDEDPWIEFTTNTEGLYAVENVPYSVQNVNGTDYCVYSYNRVGPDRLGENVTALIVGTYKDGAEEYRYTLTKSIRDYCVLALTQSSNASEKTLIVDLLNFGAEAQLYAGFDTDHLVNAVGDGLTAEMLACGTAADPVLANNRVVESATGKAAAWSSVTLHLEDTVGIKYTLNPKDADVACVKIFDHDDSDKLLATIPASSFTEKDGKKVIVFDGLTAIQMDKVVKAVAYDSEGNALSNYLLYSIESYAYSKQNSTTTNLATLVKAMMKYGRSAAAYH